MKYLICLSLLCLIGCSPGSTYGERFRQGQAKANSIHYYDTLLIQKGFYAGCNIVITERVTYTHFKGEIRGCTNNTYVHDNAEVTVYEIFGLDEP